MKNRFKDHSRSMTSLISLVCGLAVCSSATAQVVRVDNGDSNVTTGHGSGWGPWNFWSDDLPVDDSTIIENQSIFENREQIAQGAIWIGPGPMDINTIMAGDSGWLDDLNEQVLAEMVAASKRSPSVSDLIRKEFIKQATKTRGDVSVPPPSPDAGSNTFNFTQDTMIGAIDVPSNEAHSVLNLWPTIVTENGRKARIPYTFSDDMINSFIAVGGGSDDEEEINAATGVVNSLAVMLILEQELPVLFVGFNPFDDVGAEILIFENAGDGNPLNGLIPNVVNRIGAARASLGEDPTQLTHVTWSNFPSLIRSFGFVLGLDWEQRRAGRDEFIDIRYENVPPGNFPVPVPSPDGNNGPGTTRLPLDGGPLFFDQSTLISRPFTTDACTFDFDSMMLLDPDIYALLPMYFIRDAFRYVDLNGDTVIDRTPFGPDDRQINQPNPVFFSSCDIAALTELYTSTPKWFYGSDDVCSYDVNFDNVQDGRDAKLFLDLYNQADTSADLVEPFGVVDNDDLEAFNEGGVGILGTVIVPFTVQTCVSAADDLLPDTTPWFFGRNPVCPWDINDDEIQDEIDEQAFLDLFAMGDPAADLVPPFGFVDEEDLDAFRNGGAPGIIPFVFGFCDNPDDIFEGWFFGKNPNCPHDVNEDGVQDAVDIQLFLALHTSLNFVADLVPPFGQVDLADLQAFTQGDAANGIDPFTPGFCSDNGPPGPANRPGRIFPN